MVLRVEPDDVVRTGGAADREMSDPEAIGASHGLSVDNDRETRTILGPHDEGSRPLHGSASEHELHLRCVGPNNSIEISQPQNLRCRSRVVSCWTVMLDRESLRRLPINLHPYSPVRTSLTHGISIDEHADPREADARIGLGHEIDCQRS